MNHHNIFHCLTIFILLLCVNCALWGAKSGSFYFDAGEAAEKESNFKKAAKYYKKSAKLCLKELDSKGMVKAKEALYRVTAFTEEYTLSEKQLIKNAVKLYPSVDKDRLWDWIQGMNPLSKVMDKGMTYYFHAVAGNLHFRNREAAAAYIEDHGNPFYKVMENYLANYVNADYSDYTLPYDRALDIMVDFQLRIRKKDLPKSGTVKIWWPIPIQTECQKSIEVIYLEPAAFIAFQSDWNSNLGQIFFEVPVDAVKKDLIVRSQIRFKHYQQRFVVDPALVGEYDKESQLYQDYTKSYNNTLITPEIAAQAQKITDGESNPYLTAKLLYQYVIDNIDYSHPPHASLSVSGEAESVFVQEHGFGDCGAQSMYFSALCRSIGIPARSCGGYQLITGSTATHFWAEVYLPNYGWLPVDTSVAMGLGDQVNGFSEEDINAFKAYLFGQQDPRRMVIQNDVDISFFPTPSEQTYFGLCLQEPQIICDESNKIPDSKFYTYGGFNFNYDNAHRLNPEADFQVKAKDFGLESFPKGVKIMLLNRYLGKKKMKKIKVIGASEDNETLNCRLPKKLDTLAYPLYMKAKSTGIIQSSRYVIIDTVSE